MTMSHRLSILLPFLIAFPTTLYVAQNITEGKGPPKYVCTAEGWMINGDTCYHVLDRQERWHKVQFTCDLLKAKFAYVDDQSDMDAVAQAAALRSAPTVWLMGTNTDIKKPGKFIWRDGAKTEIDGALTPWAPGFPLQNAAMNQFVYMKVDLESGQSAGLAHSSDRIERYVACMLPAKDAVQAANRRLLRIQEDSSLHSTPRSVRLQKRSDSKKHRRKFRRRLQEFDQDVRHHRRRRPVRWVQFARTDDGSSDDNAKIARSAEKIRDGFVDTGSDVGEKMSHSAKGVKKGAGVAGRAVAGSGYKLEEKTWLFWLCNLLLTFHFRRCLA